MLSLRLSVPASSAQSLSLLLMDLCWLSSHCWMSQSRVSLWFSHSAPHTLLLVAPQAGSQELQLSRSFFSTSIVV